MTRFFSNRVEVTFARQTLDLSNLKQDELNQDMFGVKVRLIGDALYSPWGQWSAGVQHKRQQDFKVPEAIGAQNDSGTDVYFAESKLLFAAVFGRSRRWRIY